MRVVWTPWQAAFGWLVILGFAVFIFALFFAMLIGVVRVIEAIIVGFLSLIPY